MAASRTPTARAPFGSATHPGLNFTMIWEEDSLMEKAGAGRNRAATKKSVKIRQKRPRIGLKYNMK